MTLYDVWFMPKTREALDLFEVEEGGMIFSGVDHPRGMTLDEARTYRHECLADDPMSDKHLWYGLIVWPHATGAIREVDHSRASQG